MCVMSGVNDAGRVFFEMAGRGSLSREEAMSVLRERVRSGSIASTDKASAYVETLAELGVAAHNAYDSRDLNCTVPGKGACSGLFRTGRRARSHCFRGYARMLAGEIGFRSSIRAFPQPGSATRVDG